MLRNHAWLLLSIGLLSVSVCQGEPPAATKRVAISGQVVDEQSRPVAGVTVRGGAYTDITETTTDDDGRFVLDVSQQRATQLAIIADDNEGDRLGIYKAKWGDPPTAETLVKIQLAACRRLPVEVTDARGAAAGGVRVGAVIDYASLLSVVTDDAGQAVLRLPAAGDLQSLFAVHRGVGFDYRIVKTTRDKAHRADWLAKPPIRFQLAKAQTVQIRLVDTDDNPIAGTELDLWLLNKPGEPDSFNLGNTPHAFHATTDETGRVQFPGVPDWETHSLTFWPSNKEYVRDRIVFDAREHPDGQLTAKLNRLVAVTGHVHFADGRPAPGIAVAAMGVGYTWDGFRGSVTTDAQGNFTMQVAPHLLYMLTARSEHLAAPAIDGLIIRPDEPIRGLDFELRAATRIHGRVAVGPDKKPVAGQRINLQQAGRDLHKIAGAKLPNPENSRRWIQPTVGMSAVTDSSGRFEFYVGSGSFTLSGPSQVKAKKFEVVDETERVFDFVSPRPENGPFAGRVVTGDPPRPVAGAIIDGIYRAGAAGRDLRLLANDQGLFAGQRELHTLVLHAKSQDGKLAGIIEIGPDDTEATISIGPVASATARLIDSVTGDALGTTKVIWGRRVHIGDDDGPWRTAWGGIVTTDPAGGFQMTGLVTGEKYDLSVPRGNGSYRGLRGFTPEVPEAIELGDLSLAPPYEPPTFEERVDRQLASSASAVDRYDRALKEAARLRQHVLVVFLDRTAPLTASWFQLRLDDRPVRSALYNYQLIQVDVKSTGAAALAKRLAVSLDAEKLPAWRFSDSADESLHAKPVPRLDADSNVDRAAIVEQLGRFAPEPLDARQLLKDAFADAAKTNRRVIVQETATWCGPCHRLARYLEQHRATWEKDYVWIRVDQRWHGSDEVMNQIKAGYRGGIPWFAILDRDGKILASSDGPDGNIGFPSEPASIHHFLAMIKATKQRISERDLAELRKGLETK